MKSISNVVVKLGKKSALKNTEWLCRQFLHQPKIPAKLLAIRKSK